jgi:hypothetical protein
MKSFKVREGLVEIDGILYGQTPTDVKIKGKVGTIQSIGIGNRGQFFPISGQFNDGSIVITEDSTGIVEEVVPVKVRKTKSK